MSFFWYNHNICLLISTSPIISNNLEHILSFLFCFGFFFATLCSAQGYSGLIPGSLEGGDHMEDEGSSTVLPHARQALKYLDYLFSPLTYSFLHTGNISVCFMSFNFHFNNMFLVYKFSIKTGKIMTIARLDNFFKFKNI